MKKLLKIICLMFFVTFISPYVNASGLYYSAENRGGGMGIALIWTIMLIEGAEYFGLAQLHQFRGRINRSSHQAYCFLSLSNQETNNEKTIQRLQALQKYDDGFSIAKIDLKLRGSGDIYGLHQSGFPELKIASLFDYQLIRQAQEEAKIIINKDPGLESFPLLKKKIKQWENSLHLE